MIIKAKTTNGIPSYTRDGDAGIDLRASGDYTISPGFRVLVKTGLFLEIPKGYAGLVIPRSGLALKYGVSVANAPGLIDSNYRGEVGVILENRGPNKFDVKDGDRIAQLVIIQVPEIQFEAVDELSDTERGADGFGSSGVA